MRGERVTSSCAAASSESSSVEEGAHFLLVLSSGESSGGYTEYTQRPTRSTPSVLLVLCTMTAAIAP